MILHTGPEHITTQCTLVQILLYKDTVPNCQMLNLSGTLNCVPILADGALEGVVDHPGLERGGGLCSEPVSLSFRHRAPLEKVIGHLRVEGGRRIVGRNTFFANFVT
jgi:hypothetical protein